MSPLVAPDSPGTSAAPTADSPGTSAAPTPGRPGISQTLLRRASAPGPDGLVQGVDPASAGWEYTTFHAYRLAPGQSVERPADDQERLVLILEGRASVRSGERDFGVLGSRESVFDGPPPPVVLLEPGRPLTVTGAPPAGSGASPAKPAASPAGSGTSPARIAASPTVTATSPALVVIAAAPDGAVRRTVAIPADEVLVENRGSGQTARRIHHLLPPGGDRAGRLIAFEVFTPGGNWSSYPPHKHDTENPPVEARLEELYYYRFAKPQGFAFARVYTPDRSLDEAMTPMDGDLVVVPEGYHPVGVPAGYDCYYLNVMAGPNRAWHFTIDPDHAWLMNWDPAAPASATGDADSAAKEGDA